MQHTTKPSLFSLGQIVATPGALAALEKAGHTPQEFLSRHLKGDWGDLSDEDRTENELSLQRGAVHKRQMPFLAGGGRLAVRAVKGAGCAFTGAKRKPLYGRSGWSRRSV